MQHLVVRTLRSSLVVIGVVVFAPTLTARAGGETDGLRPADRVAIPAQCSEYFAVDEPDAPDDYRCAGIELTSVDATTGVARQVWAGQWLFVDGAGVARLGYATTTTGAHPTVTARSQSVSQPFANDVGGRRLAYLLWRYGDTSDDLTAAALWVVTQCYVGATPVSPTLDGVAAATGRADLQQRALALDGEAGWFAQQWVLSATVSSGDEGPHLVVALRSGIAPVSDRPVSVLVSGLDRPLVATTGADGTATVSVSSGVGRLDSDIGTVVVTTETPGPVVASRSTPSIAGAVSPIVVTAGRVGVARAIAGASAPLPSPLLPTPPSPPAPQVSTDTSTLPHAGSHVTEVIAGAATGFLVAGVGLVGMVSRRGATRRQHAVVHSTG